jgi:ketosteroid isomerase-like protein
VRDHREVIRPPPPALLIHGGRSGLPDFKEGAVGDANEDLIKRIHGSFAAGQYPIHDLFAAGVIWHVEGNNPLAQTYRGRDAVFTAFQSYEKAAEGTLEVRLVSVTANDDYALAVLHATGERGASAYDCFEYDVYRIENGVVAEFWSFSADQRATDAFWS